MEIERKFLVSKLPDNLDNYPFHLIEQGYLCTSPVVRVRRQDDVYYLTYKSKGMMVREEYNLPLTKHAYDHLIKKADGTIISKKRCLIPIDGNHTVELDLFDKPFEALILAEVEFSSKEEAESFNPPEWFGEDVTFSEEYHNSVMSRGNLPD